MKNIYISIIILGLINAEEILVIGSQTAKFCNMPEKNLTACEVLLLFSLRFDTRDGRMVGN